MTTIFLDLETVADPAVGWTPKTPDDFPPPFACRVVCAGMIVSGNGIVAEAHASPMPEDWILSQVFERVSDPSVTLVTWNGRGFDLPVLVARGLAHGLTWRWPWAARDATYRYSTAGHWDVADDLTLFGAGRSPKLDHAAKACGLPGKIDGDGASVAELHAAGRCGEISRYCLEDVVELAVLAARFRLLKGQSSPKTYAAFVERLFELPEASRVRERSDLRRVIGEPVSVDGEAAQ